VNSTPVGCPETRSGKPHQERRAQSRRRAVAEVVAGELAVQFQRDLSETDYAELMLTAEAFGEDLRDFFHADQIATPIAGAITVGLAESAKIARQRVVDGRRPVGWVSTGNLLGHRNAKSVMTPLNDCTLVSAESSIASVLQLLPSSKFMFVVGKQGLSGFIVRSDLDRHAVRSYLYLLIAGIEMLLSEIVKSAIADNQIIASIRSDQKRRFEQAYAANREASPAEYLYIDQLVSLFTRTSYASDPRLWDESLTDLLLRVKSFRNDIMHPVRSLAASENIETIANLPRWATEVADRLRGIVTYLTGGLQPN
jgi:hypothetical protein